MKNTQIPMCHNIKILGVIFNNKFKYNTHLKKLKFTWKTKMCVIKTLGHHTWGVKQNSLLNIIIYILLKILDLIHNEGIFLSIGAYTTSHFDRILCYAGKLPSQLHKNKDTFIFCIKMKSPENHTAHFFSIIKTKIHLI